MAKTVKRAYITEILEVKGRLPPKSERWNLVLNRMKEIEQIGHLVGFLEKVKYIESETLDEVFEAAPELSKLQDFPEITYELARSIPVGLIACVEGYFRLVYADLIDQRKPFRENVAKFDIKFGLEHLVSIEQHSISLGEFVAHFLPCNSIEDINSNMSNITGQDFLRLVKRKYPRSPPLFPEMFTGDAFISRVKRIFELRHMYCHELSPPMEEEEFSWVQFCSRTASEFLLISEYIVEELLSFSDK